MTDKKPPAADAKAKDPKDPKDSKDSKDAKDPKAAAPAQTPESRIAVLTEQLKQLQNDIRTLEGRIANRDPKLTQVLEAENRDLLKKLAVLEKTLFAVLVDAELPRTSSEFQQRYKVLQQSAVEFFKHAQIDNELWKNIES